MSPAYEMGARLTQAACLIAALWAAYEQHLPFTIVLCTAYLGGWFRSLR